MTQYFISDCGGDCFDEVIEADTEEEAVRIFEQLPNHGKAILAADLTDVAPIEEEE